MKKYYLFTFFFLLASLSLFAQNKIRVYGYVVDTNNRGIELVNVALENTEFGTTTNINGYYDISATIADSVTIVYSMMGYETIKHVIRPTQRIFPISVEMNMSTIEIADFDFVAHRIQTSTKETLDPNKHRFMPSATGGIESLFITFSGVSSNNELSSQYNVRGGNFDENIVYVNGIEVYRPLLIRSGQQEGLSFINSDMVQKVDFSSGGFDAEYGDKMSSVLDIKYKKPTSFEASASVSLLGATAYVGTVNKNFTQMHGIRYKTAAYLLGTLDTDAEYNPAFLDYQTYLTQKINTKWELTFLGNFSQNSYKFVPVRRETTYGGFNTRKLSIDFQGQEQDLFRTGFGALTLNYKPVDNLKLSVLTSFFHTNEHETYDIAGEYGLSEVDFSKEKENSAGAVLGFGRFHEHARNRLKATVANVGHQGEYIIENHKVKWGLTGQIERINDKISEWEMRDSLGYSLPYIPGDLRLIYNLKSDNIMDSWRATAFVQDTYKWSGEAARFSVTGGLRANYWNFNNELIVSPRVSLSYIPYWERDFSFRFASGVYYQSPFYKEVRREITDETTGNVNIELNKNIKAQRSVHFLVGGDHYFRAWGRPFKFTTEAYLKLADRAISYTVDNVSVRYSGKNDSKFYTAGVDFKLFGELVPGTDSWINFSLMNSKEKVDGAGYNKNVKDENGTVIGKEFVAQDWVSRPNEQRYSFSMLFQDYWPTNPKYKMNLRFVFSDGLPFGVPRSNHRATFRSTGYKRVDIGASRGLISGKDKVMNKPFFKHIKNIWFNFEVLNLLDFQNINSYYWVVDLEGGEQAAPNYLTGRQFNFKIIVDFK